MFCGQIISSDILPLTLQDTAEEALRIMQEKQVNHLPVVEGDKYLGMIAEDDLLDEEPGIILLDIVDSLVGSAVKSTDYFLVAVKLAYLFQLDVVPVASEKQEFEGLITKDTLFRHLAKTTGSEEYGSMIVMEMEKKDYSLGLFNRLVESNDAIITQMNTFSEPSTSLMTVVIRINKEEVSDIVASFQRHDFTIRYYLGEELFRNELQSNLNHLMNYLNM